MEVCGTHTHAIARHNLRELLPENVTLISGPGCPVCVAGVRFIEKIRHLLRAGVTVALFGDLMRIPGSSGTLAGEAGLKLVYSPDDALQFALANPGQRVVFAAVGFAPTLSAAAALMSGAVSCGIKNFSILSDFKIIRGVLNDLCRARRISAFLLPGHVASITGTNSFRGLGIPGAVAGFEAENILHTFSLLLAAVAAGKNDFLCNNYPAAVRDEGNTTAQRLIKHFFEPVSGIWRGLGEIPESSMKLKEEYAAFDAEKIYDFSEVRAAENPACRCSAVLTGAAAPEECPLFGRDCTPQTPVGGCMASSEGSCAAAYIYRRNLR